MVVDLPAPLGPRKPSTSPLLTEKEMPRTAWMGPKRFSRPCISINGFATVLFKLIVLSQHCIQVVCYPGFYLESRRLLNLFCFIAQAEVDKRGYSPHYQTIVNELTRMRAAGSVNTG